MVGAVPSVLKVMLLGSALSLSSGAAFAADWKIVELTGNVRVAAPGADATAGRHGQTLPVGTSVTTFQGGRAVLDNGLQHIVVGPNSRMTLAPEQGGMARVLQDLGAVMFQVDKKDKPHFRVETPLLAAVVKGTTFTVDVQPQSDSVNVAEGLVEVRSNMGDLARDVPAGAAGAVMRDAPATVQVMTLAANIGAVSAPPPAAALPPIDYLAASDGLIGGQTAPNAATASLAAAAVAAPSIAVAGPPETGVAADGAGRPASISTPTLAAQVAGTQLTVAAAASESGSAIRANSPSTIFAGLPPVVGGRGSGAGPGELDSNGKGNSGPATSNGKGNGNGNGAGGSEGVGRGPADPPGKGGGKEDKGGPNGNGAPGLGAGLGGPPDEPGKGKSGNDDKAAGNGNGSVGASAGIGGLADEPGKGKGKDGKDDQGGPGNGNGAPGLAPGIAGAVDDPGKGKGSGKDDKASADPSGGLVGAIIGGTVDAVGDAGALVNSGPGKGNGNGNGNGGGRVVNNLLAGLGKK